MVSFQCDGCGDIVKKPKLPTHRCYSTFTCIDCSTTFQGRAWDAHKSCITEVQKFQKHLQQIKNKKESKMQEQAKPISIVEQLKRKNEEKSEGKKKQKKEELSEWSTTEMGTDESKNLKFALKHILKNGEAVCLRDIRKMTIELIEKHPKYKKSENLKKAFDKTITFKLENDTIKLA